MDNEPFIILRVSRPAPLTHEVWPTPTWREDAIPKGLQPASPVTVSVQTETLSRRDQADLRRDPQVQIAAPFPVRLIAPLPSGGGSAAPLQEEGATWGVQVTGSLTSPFSGQGVTVAILDTGIDAGHEAFAGVDLVQQDFTGAGNGDGTGHGTHVAGTIFGRNTHGLRYSVAPGISRALIGRVFDADGNGSTEWIVAGLQWAIQQGAHIINLSLRFDFPGVVKGLIDSGLPADLATSRGLTMYRDNLRLFDRLGMLYGPQGAGSHALLIAAAGNESKRDVNPDHLIAVAPPAAADGMLAVAALQSPGAPHNGLTVGPFSNIGAVLAAPGVDIYSAQAGGGYTTRDGTSMASPHVTGMAALWAERQLQRSGMVNMSMLAAQVQGNTNLDRLAQPANPSDVGAGLVMAPSS